MGELKDLGRDLLDVVTKPQTGIGQIVEEWTNESIELLKEHVPKGSGALANSFIPEYDFQRGLTQVKVFANSYWDYINSGVDGTEVKGKAVTNADGGLYSFKNLGVGASMINSMTGVSGLGWIASKGIATDDPVSLAWAISKSIKKKGIEASEYMEEVFSEERLQDLENRILKLIEETL